MTIFDDLTAVAEGLFDLMLAPATIVRVGGSYDASTDTRSKTETVTPCRAAFSSRRTATTNGVVITETMATVSAKVAKGDRIRIGSTELTVEDVEVVAPAGSAIVWKAVMR